MAATSLYLLKPHSTNIILVTGPRDKLDSFKWKINIQSDQLIKTFNHSDFQYNIILNPCTILSLKSKSESFLMLACQPNPNTLFTNTNVDNYIICYKFRKFNNLSDIPPLILGKKRADLVFISYWVSLPFRQRIVSHLILTEDFIVTVI